MLTNEQRLSAAIAALATARRDWYEGFRNNRPQQDRLDAAIREVIFASRGTSTQ